MNTRTHIVLAIIVAVALAGAAPLAYAGVGSGCCSLGGSAKGVSKRAGAKKPDSALVTQSGKKHATAAKQSPKSSTTAGTAGAQTQASGTNR